MRIGLTGGIGTGKSTVGKLFYERGCYLIHADELGHEVLRSDGAAYSAVVERFGNRFLDHNGEIVRKALAYHVYLNPGELEALNAIVHPCVKTLYQERVAEIEQRDPNAIIIYECALLVECDLCADFDYVVVAWCSEEEQIQRVMKRDDLERTEVLQRIERQFPLTEKMWLADYLIDTGKGYVELTKTVDDLLAVFQSGED